MAKYVLALDQGTTSSRAILFDRHGKPVTSAQKEFSQYYPKPGWVEHDPMEIWETQRAVMLEAVARCGANPDHIEAIGITNQRETTIVWDRHSGEPVYRAIVWQCRRTAQICEELRARGLEGYLRESTGLVLDAYFSATKVKWILDNVPGARGRAVKGDLVFGTVDSWLLWKLTGGKVHATDYSNASRTMLFNITTLDWDDRILAELEIPRAMLPEVRDSSGVFGETEPSLFEGVSIPIAGVAGDQQAALFGQACHAPGTAKNTYGTGCFLIMNTGEELVQSNNGLLTTVAWGLEGRVTYALEGSIFVAGAVVQWLRDELGLIREARESELLAASIDDSGGVYVVPAFVGLGAPYWDMYARGAIVGLTRGAGRSHIVRASLESIAYQTVDVIRAIEQDSKTPLATLKVDGGAVVNNFLMQFQADILGVEVVRPEVTETTAVGAAYLAGLSTGFWKDLAQIRGIWAAERTFLPAMEAIKRDRLYNGWKRAVERARSWVEE
ncbi:MAG TPA: glycerol kinase GlpK [Spirochaetia bacterium]|nr:glycerol kinase GlpK [Spirochaetia bacterium]